MATVTAKKATSRKAVKSPSNPQPVTVRYSANDHAWATVNIDNPGAPLKVLDRDKVFYLQNPVFDSRTVSSSENICGNVRTTRTKVGVATGLLHMERPTSLRKTTDFVNFNFGDDGVFRLPDKSALTRAKWIALGGDRFATVKV